MLLEEMPWLMVDKLSRNTPVVIPVAALEQHGHHLPVFTDSMLLGEVVRRAHKANGATEPVGSQVLITPLQWLGNSEHHLDFPGSMSASPRVYLDLLRDMVENFLNHGFKRILILNGHGGNIVPAQQAMFELRQKYRDKHDLLLVSATYWLLGGQPKQVDPSMFQDQVLHACEYETSMIMRIRPELVGPVQNLETVSHADGIAPAHRAWITKDRSTCGHIGSPQFATPEKGETCFEVFQKDVVRLWERMIAWDGKSWVD